MVTMKRETTLTKITGTRYNGADAAPTAPTTKGSANGNTRPSRRATATPGGSRTPRNPPRTLSEKTLQRLAARALRRAADREARALYHLCAAETATVYEPEFGDYQPKPPGQKPQISDGTSHGRVPHSPELQADCDRFLRLLAEAPDIDPDGPPVKIDGEYVGGVRGQILQGLARGFKPT
jgi:hypothetical protein